MRRVGFRYLGVSLLALGLVRFQAGAESEFQPPLEPPETATTEEAADGAPTALQTVEPGIVPSSAPPTADRTPERTPPADLATRTAPEPGRVEPSPMAGPAPGEPERGSRRRVNRYPGPIPTPADWAPPEGPVRIALQAGHWRAHEAPDELRGLRDNGTRWEDTAEWEANLDIAGRAAEMLRELGYEVDLLPAVVPPGYRAHLFISIHADGSTDGRASGFRVASPRLDATGRAERIASLLEETYGEETGIRLLPTVTRRMQNYYAFNFRRYEHALHPMTIAVILETGFLTSASDREVILGDPDRAARGIVAAVTRFPETPAPRATTSEAGGR